MARGGVTFTEVDEAARYLQGLGRNPTVDAIREKLGTGSRTTLAEHLKRWKSLQADGEGRLPQPLLALVTGLWESLQATADQRIQENEAIAHQELSFLKAQHQTLNQAEQQLKQTVHVLQEKFDVEQRTTNTLTQQLQASQTTYDKLQSEHQLLLQQLNAAHQENQRLHQLAHQIQTNLEHYQQAIANQQVEQQLAKEKQQAAFMQEIQQLKTTLKAITEKYHQAEKRLSEKEHRQNQLQEKYNALFHQQEKLSSQSQVLQIENITLKAEQNLLQKQLSEQKMDFNELQKISQSQQEKIAVLNTQSQQARAELHQAQDKIETLRHEKLFLVQEKSQLEGALKQCTIATN